VDVTSSNSPGLFRERFAPSWPGDPAGAVGPNQTSIEVSGLMTRPGFRLPMLVESIK